MTAIVPPAMSQGDRIDFAVDDLLDQLEMLTETDAEALTVASAIFATVCQLAGLPINFAFQSLMISWPGAAQYIADMEDNQ